MSTSLEFQGKSWAYDRGNMKKSAKIVPLLLAMVFLLTGCVKMNMDFVVNADDTADLSMIMAVEKETLDGQSFDDFRNQYAGGSDPFEGLPENATKEAYSDDKFEGYRVRIENQPLADVLNESTTSTSGKIEHRDGKFFVETSPMDLGENSSQARMVFTEATMSFTFPGKIVSATDGGTIEGNKVTYNIFDLQDGAVLSIEAEDSSGPNLTWLWWVLGGVVLLALAALVWVLTRRKAKNDAAATVAEGATVPAVPTNAPATVVPPVPDHAPAVKPRDTDTDAHDAQ